MFRAMIEARRVERNRRRTNMPGWLVAVVFVVILCGSHAATAGQTRLRMSVSQPPNDAIVSLIETWAERIRQQFPGELRIDVYPGGELYGTRGEITAVVRGHIEAALVTVDYWGRTIPVLGVLAVPYGMHGLPAISAYRGEPLDRRLTTAIEGKGLKVLGWLAHGRNAAITTPARPLLAPADCRGLKIRSAGFMLNEALQAVGASPVAMTGADVYMSLQTGMLDGALTIPQAVYRRRYFEVNGAVTITPLFVTYQTLAVNERWWRSLPAPLQEALISASRELELDAERLAASMDAAAPGLLRQKGMEVHSHSPAEIETFRAAMAPAVTAAFLATTGSDGADALRELRMRRQKTTQVDGQ